MTIFNCYIDESGDEGLTPKSKPWFVLSALVVSEDEEKLVRGFEYECKRQVWIANRYVAPQQVHFSKLTHSQKLGVSKMMNERQFTLIVVAMYKPKMPGNAPGLTNYMSFFRYTTRYLLERVSWYVDDLKGSVNIVFSNRRSFNLRDLIDYVSLIKRDSRCQIRDVFNPTKIRVKDPHNEEMLRAADVCASSFGNGLNPDEYGQINHYYADELFTHLYRYNNGRVWSYGFKAFPCTMHELAALHPHTANWVK